MTSNDKKYDLAIAHRACPVLAKTAAGYTDKLEMVKATTASLAKSISGMRTKLFVILDGCPPEYDRLFDDAFASADGIDYERIATPSIGNNPTYAKQMELLSTMVADAQCLYFSEDDYIYRPNAFRAMTEFLEEDGVDFVTPLDHPDSYQKDRERTLSGAIRVSEHCHWREVATTCCTFMLKAETFERAKKSLSHYAKGGTDYIMGELLTKKDVFSPRAVIGGGLKYAFGREHNWLNLLPALAWMKLGPRLLFAPRFRLWSPMPSLAVHLCKPSLPPLCGMLTGE